MIFFRRGTLVLAMMLLSFPHLRAVSGPDAVENLIDQQRERRDAWDIKDDAAVPSVFLLGDKTAAEIYSPATAQGEPNGLCDVVNFDELFDLSQASPEQREIPLNTSVPRIKEIISESCLIRPGDRLVAIGAGLNRAMEVASFVLRKEKPLCPEDRGYSLWAVFDTPLDFYPLLVSTDINLMAGANNFDDTSLRTGMAPTKEEFGVLAATIPFVRDYDVRRYDAAMLGERKIFLLVRHEVSLDDVGLPSAMVVAQSTGAVQILATVNIKRREKSGHLSMGAILDYDLDGKADLWIEGDENGCAFRLLYQGTAVGYDRLDTPNKPCSC